MSASLNKDKSSSDYHSVVEQSGIKAEAGGFDITVTGTTNLTGGIIASSASADKKSLTTGSITTSDITNSAHATASSHGFSLSGNDTIKNITKNVLNHGKAKDGAEGETKSAISDGTIILTNTTGQRSMGQDAGEIIGSLNRNTATAHQAVAPIDATSLEGAVHNRLDMINDLSDEGLGYFYKIYKIAYATKHPEGEVAHDENGNVLYLTDENGKPIKGNDGKYITLYHFLKPEEENHLQKGSDGEVHMFYNGIFTSPDDAARYAVQFADNDHGHLYFTYFPQDKDMLVEVGIAVFQKFFEGTFFFGLTNSTKKFQNTMYLYGNDGLRIDGHSRGSMTVGNGMHDFEKRGIHGIAGNTSINLFGPAYNAQSMANTLDYLSDGKQTSVGLENHAYDFVGIKFGGNPATFDKIPSGSSPGNEAWRIFTTYPTVHACYGHAGRECTSFYGSSHRIQINSIQSGGKK
ncbi:filamentous hemagglutinin [Bartonella kosoyi]|uniref:Filamentous hemagglutinin n=2 Tax=Bartonella kosoyi TaxID=2133959 RepID=A0A5B9CXK9_9HYPH|nr:filamentous hemagglutinin [Bartonella kosoyi]